MYMYLDLYMENTKVCVLEHVCNEEVCISAYACLVVLVRIGIYLSVHAYVGAYMYVRISEV